MQCPLCIETVLEPRFHGGIEIDVCPKCKGIWLDRGELEKLASTPATPITPMAERRRDWDDDDDDDWNDDRREKSSKKSKKSKKKKRKKSLGERLVDVLEEVID